MNASSTNSDPTGDFIPVRPVQVRLARLGLLGVIMLFIAAQFFLFGGSTITVEMQGDATIYRSESSNGLFLFAFPVLTGTIAVVYLLQPGIFRWFGAAMILITLWVGYMAFTMDTSHHHVKVSPEGVIREVGTTRDPVRHEIQFAQTESLFIDDINDNRGSRYELVAYAAEDGAETRIPIYEMMRAALPQILEAAARHDIVLEEAEDGEIIPAGLRARMKQ